MKNQLIILPFIASLLICPVTFGQTSNKCDTIYEFVDQIPKYDKEVVGLMDYLDTDLIPIISESIMLDSILVSSLLIILTIDKNGHVIDATFPRPNLTEHCKSDLKKKLLTMSGWKPGQLKGKNVCTHFYWPISCILWQ